MLSNLFCMPLQIPGALSNKPLQTFSPLGRNRPQGTQLRLAKPILLLTFAASISRQRRSASSQEAGKPQERRALKLPTPPSPGEWLQGSCSGATFPFARSLRPLPQQVTLIDAVCKSKRDSVLEKSVTLPFILMWVTALALEEAWTWQILSDLPPEVVAYHLQSCSTFQAPRFAANELLMVMLSFRTLQIAKADGLAAMRKCISGEATMDLLLQPRRGIAPDGKHGIVMLLEYPDRDRKVDVYLREDARLLKEDAQKHNAHLIVVRHGKTPLPGSWKDMLDNVIELECDHANLKSKVNIKKIRNRHAGNVPVIPDIVCLRGFL